MKKKMTVLGGLLMAVAVTGYSVSGTYAKYISSVDMTDEARVAKWDINFEENGTEIATNKTIDLFQESYTLGAEADKYVYVKSLDNDRVVAPGTEGAYSFDIKGVTETNYTLKVEVLDTSKNDVVLKGADDSIEYDPIRFSVDGGTTWVDFAGLNTAINAQFANKVYSPSATVAESVSIQWKWVFDADEATTANATNTGTGAVSFVSDNAKDTTLGNEIVKDATSHTIKLNLRVTAEQTTEKATA